MLHSRQVNRYILANAEPHQLKENSLAVNKAMDKSLKVEKKRRASREIVELMDTLLCGRSFFFRETENLVVCSNQV